MNDEMTPIQGVEWECTALGCGHRSPAFGGATGAECGTHVGPRAPMQLVAAPSSVREGGAPDLTELRRGLPNPVRLVQIELGGRGSDYGWRVDSDCGVVKVYSTRDGCMFAVDPQTAREIARAFHAALSDAADVTELRSYGHLYRAGEMTPAAVDAVNRAKEATDAV